MAADIIGEQRRSERKRKGKRRGNHPKLLVDDKVEVRSEEEGFRGSWHSGTVIACESQAREVQYDHLLCDDGSKNLVETVKVSPIIDGIIPSSTSLYSHRGSIRPLPLPRDLHKWSLPYGRCVDVYHDEAWWEGVVFDHEDGSENRTIFFPDMGDEMQVKIDKLRITCDWDELTEDWKPRRDWLFLELVEEFEQQWPLQVSVRQIWYEVRGKKGFQKLVEWTSINSGIWNDLIREVVLDNCNLTINHFFKKSLQPLSEETHLDDTSRPDDDSGHSHAVIPIENDGSDSPLLVTNLLTGPNMACHEETPSFPPPALSISPSKTDDFSRLYLNLYREEGFSSPSSRTTGGKFEDPSQRRTNMWLPAGHDIVPGAEFCPDAVNDYPSQISKLNVKKHLAYLGWTIEFQMDGHNRRMRYTSPDGKSYFSLVKVCEALRRESAVEIPSFASRDDKRISATVSDSSFSSPLSEQLPQESTEVSVMTPLPSDTLVESEYCPQAVVDYYFLGLVENTLSCYRPAIAKNLQLKAKKHLSALGWSFWYIIRKEKRLLRYSSPSGKIYISLRKACKGCIDEGGVNESNAVTSRPSQNMNASGEARGQLHSERLSSSALADMEFHDNSISPYALSESCLIEPRRRTMNGVLPHAKDQQDGSRMPKKRKKSGSLRKSREDLGGDCPTRVLRSSKRARQVVAPSSSSSYQNPRTVLSWLIDNNIVLPRAKVQYISRKDHRPIAEGKITGHGIKCNCCQRVFTLSKFEAHAGSTYHRPAANIFLEDGRSLLDCQSQLRCRNSKKNLMSKQREMKGRQHHIKNDYICSTCHLGGELLLCDKCPSSFHASCLDLKDIPDGDWFCPSCCCGICGRSRLYKHTEQFTDDSVLICDQCEHQYHVGCLRERGASNVDSYPKGSWFCSKSCKQKLLGKSVPVGEDNLTWTLLKYTNYDDDDDRGGSDMEVLTETYGKLNVALSVMHECFEPVKEPRTKRDLVEDVIFSRW
ncbi:hypothetical protein U1Q18_033498 [Sarracenia purpurea var. burkii]